MMKRIEQMKQELIKVYTEKVNNMTEKDLLNEIYLIDDQKIEGFPVLWSCEICKAKYGDCDQMLGEYDFEASEEFCNKRFHSYCEEKV